MTRAGRFLIIVAALAMLAVGCMTSTATNTTDTPPSPVPTEKPVFIPTTAPPPATPTSEPVADEAEGTASEDQAAADTAASDDANDADADDIEETEQEPGAEQPTVTPEPTEAPQVIPVPTQPPRPTRAPTPRPTLPAVSACPGGQVVVGGSCACPAGQAKRASDSQCVRLCNQADLTIANTCVCTGDLYDNGGQCVKRCKPGEVTDQFGGCKLPGTDG